MSVAKQCDICGTFYKPYAGKLLAFNLSNINAIRICYSHNDAIDNRAYIDICPDCLKAFDKFLQSRMPEQKSK